MTNVIPFPVKNNIKTETFSDPNFSDEDQKINLILHELMPIVFYGMYELGIDATKTDCAKDAALIVESLRSFFHKNTGKKHPLQSVSNSLFERVGNDALIMNDDIHFTTTKSESN